MEVEKHLEKAQHCLDAIDNLDSIQDTEAIINRCYYCIFHSIPALLLSQNIRPKTHSGLLNKFAETFIKTKLWDTQFMKMASDAFDSKQNADYEIYFEITLNEVRTTIDAAKLFLKTTQDFIISETH